MFGTKKNLRLAIGVLLVIGIFVAVGYLLGHHIPSFGHTKRSSRQAARNAHPSVSRTAVPSTQLNPKLQQGYQGDLSNTPSVFVPYVKAAYKADPKETVSSEMWPFAYGQSSGHQYVIQVLILSYGQWGQNYMYAYAGKVYKNLNGLTPLVSKKPHFNSSVWTASITAF
ncbi:hypothetical protein LLE49_10105 [Alicyclobacillus tolerans]|uniref:hypothetical protein n=1 Tax=Alicyclobacillus tolerans TaxID=90970 RepID=UPI001F2C6310|nr:hypothetical protein [Alicyclobacillus tolerans]MCF8565067.1 hypothetical protein [Alicyclobacillus tolerans]